MTITQIESVARNTGATSAAVWTAARDHVRLRPIGPADMGFLYRLAAEGETGERWRYRGAVPNPQAFADHLWDGVLVQSIVERVVDGRPAGLVCAYNANLRDGYVYLGGVCDAELMRTGVGAQGMMLLCDQLFREWSFRKIYFEAAAFNYEQFSSGAGRFLVEEARLSDHTFHDGRYWDLIVGSLSRQTWTQLRTPRGRPELRHDGPLMGIDEFCVAVDEALGLNGAPVTPDTRLAEDLGVDSLGALALQDLIESEAGVTEFDLSEGLGTVRDAYALYLTASAAPPRPSHP